LEQWSEHEGRKGARKVRRMESREVQIGKSEFFRKRRNIMQDDDDLVEEDVDADEVKKKDGEKRKMVFTTEGEKMKTTLAKKKKHAHRKEGEDLSEGSDSSVSSESTRSSDLQDNHLQLNPVQIRFEKLEEERTFPLSTNDLEESRRRIVEERMGHPSKQARKQVH
jgi:hypothetical protein